MKTMNLGDFLGAILSEATLARVHADLEAVRVAELYAKHPMLEGAPIPRFRLPEFNVNVPIVIKDVTSGTNQPLLVFHETPGKNEIGSSVHDAAKASGLSMTTKEEKALIEKLLKIIDDRWGEPLEVVPALKVVNVLKELSIKILTEMKLPRRKKEPATPEEKANEAHGAEETVREAELKASTAKIKIFSNAFRRDLHSKIIGKLGASNRIQIISNTSDVREVGEAAMLTTLSLKICEDGFEFVEIEHEDGSTDTRLVPE